MFRQVREDVELEGVPVPAGSTLWLMFGSANRDESVFPDPDRFDPTRSNLKEHVAFGRGAEPWEVANVMVFLASDYSSYMTGECVAVSSQRA